MREREGERERCCSKPRVRREDNKSRTWKGGGTDSGAEAKMLWGQDIFARFKGPGGEMGSDCDTSLTSPR